MLKNNQLMVLKAGLLAGAVLFVLAAVEDWLFAGLYASSDPAFWKTTLAGKWWLYSALYHLIVGLLLALFYGIFHNSLPGQNSVWNKGAQYGFWIWLVGTVPGLLMTLMSMALPEELVIVWLITGLFNYLLAGLIISAVVRGKR